MSHLTLEKPKCPSCGVPYMDHLGLTGTCAKLKSSEKAVRELLNVLVKIDEGTKYLEWYSEMVEDVLAKYGGGGSV